MAAGEPGIRATSSGARFMERRLGLAARHLSRGVPCFAVFDIDNTLVDTRPRTLHMARTFDRDNGSSWFRSLTLRTTGVDAADTCARVGGVPAGVRRRFEAAWRDGFWNPANFALDRPVKPVIAWAKRAHAAGLGVRLLTGRWTLFEQTSVAQLRRAGMSFVEVEHTYHKPSPRVWTKAYKAQVIRELMGRGFVAWYVTESRLEVAHIQTVVRGAPCVLADCSLEPKSIHVRPRTPRLARTF